MVQCLCRLACQPWLYICHKSPVYDTWYQDFYHSSYQLLLLETAEGQRRAMRFSIWGNREHGQKLSQLFITRVKFSSSSSDYFCLFFHDISSLINPHWNSQLFISQMAHKEILSNFQRIILEFTEIILLGGVILFWFFIFLFVCFLPYTTSRVVLEFKTSESFK